MKYEYFKDYRDAYRQLYFGLDLKESTIKDIVKKIDKKFKVKRNGKEIISFEDKIKIKG